MQIHFLRDVLIAVASLDLKKSLIGSLRSRTAEKRRRQAFFDERDNNFVEITFRQTSPFFKQISL